MGRELASGDCVGECRWSAADDVIDGLPVFACGGCQSEWTAGETWTPRNSDGELDAGVAGQRALHPVNTSPW